MRQHLNGGLLAAGLVICAITQLLAGPPAPVPAQSRMSKISIASMIREWVKLAAAHQAGEADAAALAVSDWQPNDLFDMFIELKQLPPFRKSKWVKQRDDTWTFLSKEPKATLKPDVVISALGLNDDQVLSPVFTRVLFRAVLLHTDAAVLTVPGPSKSSTSPFTGLQTLLGRDGQLIGAGDGTWHLEFASVLLDGVWPDVTTDERARAWYDAAAVQLLRVSWIGEAEWLLGRAVARFPNDARLSFLRGTVDETYAMPAHQQARRDTTIMDADTHLNRASLSIERSVTLNPDLAEARLHAGRVASLLARHKDAGDHLRRVTDAFGDPVLQYYAALFLGFEQEQTGDAASARASYERATHLFPEASSPLLALSALARRSGDSAEALASVRRLLRLPKQADRQEDDPWWSYERSHVRDADERLAAWRVRVSNEAAR